MPMDTRETIEELKPMEAWTGVRIIDTGKVRW
jgi:hypothetical protein